MRPKKNTRIHKLKKRKRKEEGIIRGGKKEHNAGHHGQAS